MRRSIRRLSDGFYSPIEAEAAERFIAVPDPDVIADGTFYVIEATGEIVACGGWSARRKLFTGSSEQEGLSDERLDPRVDAARIRAFFIDPGHARQGLGTVLYLECKRSALAAGFMSLELVATLPGVPFYARLGFEEVEPVPAKLPDGTVLPCIRMCRTIAKK
ncbi:Acetyltransferase, GNAT family [Fimbriimonas ginsengisoli Gsoil 348]|uniref:Acetyltransferase, GNAT family n=2 Tax=Fimbriimonas ginsengisoli TaxID=1005039 RepID=A0A068NNS2_FIMGI|nr:Acetyltransferase, GNAT family [Fimbriimonas ginsengisoli Gsoil 348]